MHFFLQSDKHTIDKEILDLKYILSNFGNQFTHEVDEISKEDISTAKFGQGVNVPIGDLNFVGAFLKNVKGDSYIKPLEIPEFLRKDEYLKREYNICKFKDLPKTGTYFIKDASFLKNWEARTFFMPFLVDTIPKIQVDWDEHDYVCSEVLDTIYSEYRVLVFDDMVVGVQYYGSHSSVYAGVLNFPDRNVIENIIDDIKKFKLAGGVFPKSYTLDVAVTPRGTLLLEVHNFVSCGTYGFCEKELIYMYRDGIDFLLNN